MTTMLPGGRINPWATVTSGYRTLGDMPKHRQTSVVVEQQVQLAAPLVRPETRPVEHARAQLNHRGIQRE